MIEVYCQNDISFNTVNLINSLIEIQFKNLICKLKIRSLVCQNENNILLKSIYIFCYKFSLAWPNLIVISLPRDLYGKTGYFDLTAKQAPPPPSSNLDPLPKIVPRRYLHDLEQKKKIGTKWPKKLVVFRNGLT